MRRRLKSTSPQSTPATPTATVWIYEEFAFKVGSVTIHHDSNDRTATVFNVFTLHAPRNVSPCFSSYLPLTIHLCATNYQSYHSNLRFSLATYVHTPFFRSVTYVSRISCTSPEIARACVNTNALEHIFIACFFCWGRQLFLHRLLRHDVLCIRRDS